MLEFSEIECITWNKMKLIVEINVITWAEVNILILFIVLKKQIEQKISLTRYSALNFDPWKLQNGK